EGAAGDAAVHLERLRLNGSGDVVVHGVELARRLLVIGAVDRPGVSPTARGRDVLDPATRAMNRQVQWPVRDGEQAIPQPDRLRCLHCLRGDHRHGLFTSLLRVVTRAYGESVPSHRQPAGFTAAV